MNDQEKLLALFRERPMTSKQVAEVLGITWKPAQKRIARLRAKKLVCIVERRRQPEGQRGKEIQIFGLATGQGDAPALPRRSGVDYHRAHRARKKALAQQAANTLWGGLGVRSLWA